jgi:hypothetical protein
LGYRLWSRVYDSNVFRKVHSLVANHTASLLLAAPLGVEPRNEWFKATLLYQFAYSAVIIVSAGIAYPDRSERMVLALTSKPSDHTFLARKNDTILPD